MSVKGRFKQQLPGNFSDDYGKDVVRRAGKHGAGVQLPGGRIGAFVMVCCPDGQQEAVLTEFREFREVELGFSESGSSVLAV